MFEKIGNVRNILFNYNQDKIILKLSLDLYPYQVITLAKLLTTIHWLALRLGDPNGGKLGSALTELLQEHFPLSFYQNNLTVKTEKGQTS